MTHLIWIAAGGAAGAMARYGICQASLRCLGDGFAWGVLIANAIGCFALGVLMHLALRPMPALMTDSAQSAYAGLTVGLLGALTTFSTFGYDTVVHWQRGEWHLAVANVVASLAIGLSAVVAGQCVGRVFFPMP